MFSDDSCAGRLRITTRTGCLLMAASAAVAARDDATRSSAETADVWGGIRRTSSRVRAMLLIVRSSCAGLSLAALLYEAARFSFQKEAQLSRRHSLLSFPGASLRGRSHPHAAPTASRLAREASAGPVGSGPRQEVCGLPLPLQGRGRHGGTVPPRPFAEGAAEAVLPRLTEPLQPEQPLHARPTVQRFPRAPHHQGRTPAAVLSA